MACLCLLFPARPRPIEEPPPAEALSRDEKRLGSLLIATLALWMSDAVHGVSPAWIGLAAACLCLLPRIGFLNGEEFAAGVNARTCIYIAGILSLAAFVSYSGLGTVIGEWLLRILPLDPARPENGFGALVGLASALNFAVTANGVPALFTPLAQSLADASGLPLLTVLMAQVIGYATPLLPYQAAPIVVAMGMGQVPAKDGIRLCLALAAITFFLLVPLDHGWFVLLGWIPR
ncbi:SLC13 family permease [Azorhizophilus paspali]|uniref:SLC13 family permease n=1 Tax=Azorhizophilus paspali TaxID=69963 RepID=UPI00362B3A87